MRLILLAQNKNSFTARQVNDLLNNKELPFGDELTVNALDSNYSSPEYIAQTHDQANLVKRRENNLAPSPSQVQRQMAGIILSFEQDPFLPKLQIKGKGRQPGQTLPKRERDPVRKKEKKR